MSRMYENKIVELKADVHAVWKLQCQNLYNSEDLAALAVRECIQNSLDSIRRAMAQKTIKRGKIAVSWEGSTLFIEDNGEGMSVKTLHEKFLTLGGTTKGGDEVGGFGLAKSVILGCGSGFKVETQDNVFTSEDLGKRPIGKQSYRQGTKITVYDAQVGKGKLISDRSSVFNLEVKDYIYSSEIPKDVDITVNGVNYPLQFKPSKKTSRLPAELGISTEMIPRDTNLRINVYKTDNYSHYLYVRLRGLTQFKTYLSWNANCDIVLDFDTNINPRDVDYPFSTNREGLKAQYQGIIDAIRDTVSQAPMSIARDTRYKETLYDNANGNEKAREMSVALVSPAVVNSVKSLKKVVENMGGITPQGGYTPVTIADYLTQYAESLDTAIGEEKVTKTQVVKQLPPDTLFKLNNPLQYSWLVYEDTMWKHKRLSKSRIISTVALWELILKVMSSKYADATEVYPGIVLEDGTLGMCTERYITKDGKSEKRCYVMVNPLLIPQGSYQKVALYLMGVAAHELSHAYCGSFEAHGETFSYKREKLMNLNLDELSHITALVKAANLRGGKKTTSSEYREMSIAQLEELAKSKGIDIKALQAKYTDSKIYRMRVIMKLKRY